MSPPRINPPLPVIKLGQEPSAECPCCGAGLKERHDPAGEPLLGVHIYECGSWYHVEDVPGWKPAVGCPRSR